MRGTRRTAAPWSHRWRRRAPEAPPRTTGAWRGTERSCACFPRSLHGVTAALEARGPCAVVLVSARSVTLGLRALPLLLVLLVLVVLAGAYEAAQEAARPRADRRALAGLPLAGDRAAHRADRRARGAAHEGPADDAPALLPGRRRRGRGRCHRVETRLVLRPLVTLVLVLLLLVGALALARVDEELLGGRGGRGERGREPSRQERA